MKTTLAYAAWSRVTTIVLFYRLHAMDMWQTNYGRYTTVQAAQDAAERIVKSFWVFTYLPGIEPPTRIK